MYCIHDELDEYRQRRVALWWWDADESASQWSLLKLIIFGRRDFGLFVTHRNHLGGNPSPGERRRGGSPVH
jgi:hypothetical protein